MSYYYKPRPYSLGPAKPYKPYKPPKKPRNVRVPLRGGPKMKMNNSRTQTLTKTKRRKPNYGVQKTGDNSSISKSVIGTFKRPGLSLLRSLGAPQTISSVTSGRLTCNQGVQKADFFQTMSVAQLTAIKTALIPVSDPTPNANVKFLLRSSLLRCVYKNQTNIPARCIIYDIICKKSTQSTAIDNPLEAWGKGLNDMGLTNAETTVGITPYKSSEFRRHYVIARRKYFTLEPGQQHEHILQNNYNYVVDSADFENVSTQSVKSLTRYSMIVYYGQLAHESTAPGTVTTAPITLDYMLYSQYSYSSISPVKPTYSLTNALPTTVVDFDHMGETQDADSNVNVA